MMKAVAVFPGKPHTVHLEQLSKPLVDAVPNGRGVLVKILRVGVGGVDREVGAAEYGSAPEGFDFLVMGHENFGRVEAVGPNVTEFERGDYVVAVVRRPGLVTLRPADANEVVEAWKVIMQLRHEPAALILSRQALPTLDRTKYAPAYGVAKGGYVLADTGDGQPDVLLLASGSEVQLCVHAYEQLKAEGIKARVVSLPSWELFEQQSEEYQEGVIPPEVNARVSVEQASTFGWARFVGRRGRRIGMKTFGASAPLKELQKKFGFNTETVVAAAKEMLAKAG